MFLSKRLMLPILMLTCCLTAAGAAAQSGTNPSQNAAIDEALLALLGNADINDFLQTRRSEEIRGGYYQVRTGDSLDELLERVDFLSVGSNDLVQYLTAADRDNRRVANRHPMSQKELDDFTDDEWTRFPQALINKYVKSFAAKCARCASRGGKC